MCARAHKFHLFEAKNNGFVNKTSLQDKQKDIPNKSSLVVEYSTDSNNKSVENVFDIIYIMHYAYNHRQVETNCMQTT